MKTKRQFFSLALAALVLGACSDDLGVNNGQPQGGVGAGETGYVSLAINLPTQPSTRAANDDFDDGDASEYKVTDATLLVFQGSAESTSVLQGIYELGGTATDYDPEDDQITSKYSYVQEITRPTASATDNIYALVVLNKNGLLTKEVNNTWKVGGNTALTPGSTTFSGFNAALELDLAKVASRTDATNGSFLMLNAPLYNAQGGDVNPTTPDDDAVQVMVLIDPENIFDSEADAKANPAANIYVERAVAKVTVTNNASTSVKPEGVQSFTVAHWTLDQTNKKSYPVRNVFHTDATNWWGYAATGVSTDEYRFVGGAVVEDGLYRTYWGADPNYDGTGYTDGTTHDVTTDGLAANFYSLAGHAPMDDELTEVGETYPLYCLENTFDVDNMRKDQTTRAIVAVKLTLAADAADADGSFYVLNNVKSTFYKETDIVNLIKQAYLDNPSVQAALHDETSGLAAGQTLDPASDITVTWQHGTETADADLGNLSGGTALVASIYVDDDAASKFKAVDPAETGVVPDVLKEANDDNFVSALNSSYKISRYKEGVAYYPVLIQHFGDDLTPWEQTDAEDGSSYNGNEKDYLGRYGVLRNNWYTINVTSVKSIGSAEVEPEHGEDDPAAAWMSVEINILSWAVRTQDVEL